jgi:hypothetical protein
MWILSLWTRPRKTEIETLNLNNMLPLPRHLKDILKPTGDDNNEYSVKGKIICDCGSESFFINFVGDATEYKIDKVIKEIEHNGQFFLIVKANCCHCGKTFLIFDKALHGWDGFVCKMYANDLPSPEFNTWRCNRCGNDKHSLTVKINSQGQDNITEEAGEGFDRNDWTEAFEWITIQTTCNSCGEINKEWISFETA